MHFLRILLFLALGLFLCAQTQAQQTRPLADRDVRAFVASFPELRRLGEKYEAEFAGQRGMAPGGSAQGPPDMFAGALTEMKASRGYGEFLAILRKHGFDDAEQWADVSGRVMAAFLSIKMGAAMPQMQAQIEQARKQIEANPSLTREQKQVMLERMQASMGMMRSSQASAADIATVQPHAAAIERIMAMP
jgi:hypothetical protein